MSPRQTIALVLLVTICLLLLSIYCFLCIACRLPVGTIHRGRLLVFGAMQASSVITSLPTAGLDDLTIQSYPKVVLGESRHLPGLDELTCSICLAEYSAGESVRHIPDCQHCFHADCVDEWLKMKASCPVCRHSQLV